MKKRVAFMAGLMLASCGVSTLAVLTPNATTTTVYAKKKKFKAKKIKTFPKAYRGTWYHYLGNGSYNEMTITKNTLLNTSPGAFVFQPQIQMLKTEKKHGYVWVNTRDAATPASVSFHLRTTKVKIGKKHYKAIVEVRGSAFSMPVNFYNKKVAHD